jgi:cell division septal protein FtsQ
MNRRKTIRRRWSLSRLWRAAGNRRLQERRRVPSAPVDVKGALRSALHVGLIALKVVVVLGVVGGVGVGGYYGYRRLMASTYFSVAQIEVRGAKRAPEGEVVRLVQSVKGRNIFAVDLPTVARLAKGHPWIKSARVSRELPNRLTIDVEEHHAQALLLLGHLYLVSDSGHVFKRADPEESQGLAVITGLDRAGYLGEPSSAAWHIQRAMSVLERYYRQPRPALSEVNLGPRGEVTLYLRRGGVAVRLGSDASDERLGRFDAVWAALGPEVSRARVMFLDNEIRADRVTVRMASN